MGFPSLLRRSPTSPARPEARASRGSEIQHDRDWPRSAPAARDWLAPPALRTPALRSVAGRGQGPRHGSAEQQSVESSSDSSARPCLREYNCSYPERKEHGVPTTQRPVGPRPSPSGKRTAADGTSKNPRSPGREAPLELEI